MGKFNFLFKKVIDSFKNMPTFSLEELASDPNKALSYLESYYWNYVSLLKRMPEWHEGNKCWSIKLADTGRVHRFKSNHNKANEYWGYVAFFKKRSMEKRTPVFFKSRECFFAWALVYFEQASKK